MGQVAAIETAVPSLFGAALGVFLAYLLRPAVAQIPVSGTRMFVNDLTTGWAATAAVVVAVVTASALVAGHRTARAGIGPLGATRAVLEKTPRAWRILPLIAGLASMITAVIIIRVLKVHLPWLESPLIVGGFALILVGIVVIGPWLTLVASRVGLWRARNVSAVIAASRIGRTPVATFRSVSGLVVAVFVVSVFAGGSSIIQTEDVPPARPGLVQHTALHATVAEQSSPAEVLELARRAEEVPGITSAVIGYSETPLFGAASVPDLNIPADDAPKLGFENIPEAGVVAFDFSFLYFWTTQPVPLKAAAINKVEGLLPAVVVVSTDGSPEAMDRARTILNSSGITAMPAASAADNRLQTGTRLVQGLAVLAYLGMFVAIAIAGISWPSPQRPQSWTGQESSL
ncbi:hypothetical protein ACW0JT_05845 [Arthrobacter sp. SA17]